MKPNVLQEIEDELKQTSDVTNKFVKKKLGISIVRWTITAILYILLWSKFAWLKWTLIIVIPLALFNLYQIFKLKNSVSSKVQDIQDTIDSIEGID